MAKGRRPLEFRRKDIHCGWKRAWDVLQSKKHSWKAEATVMWCKRCLVSVVLGNFNLPIPAVFVQGWENLAIASCADLSDHAWYLVPFPDCYSVQFPIIDADAECDVFLRDEIDWWCRFRTGRFDNVHGEHSGDPLFLEFSQVRLCLIWDWINWSAVHLVMSIRLCTGLIEPTNPSHMPLNCVSMEINFSRCVQYLSVVVCSSFQSAPELSFEFVIALCKWIHSSRRSCGLWWTTLLECSSSFLSVHLVFSCYISILASFFVPRIYDACRSVWHNADYQKFRKINMSCGQIAILMYSVFPKIISNRPRAVMGHPCTTRLRWFEIVMRQGLENGQILSLAYEPVPLTYNTTQIMFFAYCVIGSFLLLFET